MSETILFHRENDYEWRFVGIWADMISKNILKQNEANLQDFLVLFKKYDTSLQVLQDNLRLRNLYNKYKMTNLTDAIDKMDKEIETQISDLSNKTEFCVYHTQTDTLMTVL